MTNERWQIGIISLSLCAGCDPTAAVGSVRAPLEPVCAESESTVQDGEWLCPEEFTVECDQGDGTAEVASIFVVEDAEAGCTDEGLQVNDPGPFALGLHSITVSHQGSDAGPETLCVATLRVVDTMAPDVEELEVTLFPPNHRMHTLRPEDCVKVEDACQGSVQSHFTWATSDEPVDALGDGSTEPDIVMSCNSVELRVERQGGGDGRAYRLGYAGEDSNGNGVTGSCLVVIPHDRSGREAVEGAPAYEVTAPDCSD